MFLFTKYSQFYTVKFSSAEILVNFNKVYVFINIIITTYGKVQFNFSEIGVKP